MRAVVAVALCFGSGVAFAKKGGPKIVTTPFVQPSVGVVSYSDGTTTHTGATMGGQAGIKAHLKRKGYPKANGQVRLAGDYLVGSSGVSGYEARLGAFAGPSWKYVGLQLGPDVFYSAYTFQDVVLEPTLGVATPLTVSGGYKVIDGYVGVSPAFFVDGDRDPVDWGQAAAPGFGDEFSYLAGVGVQLGKFYVTGGVQYRVTAGGAQRSSGLGVKLKV